MTDTTHLGSFFNIRVLLIGLGLVWLSPVLSQSKVKLEGLEHPYLFFSESDLPEIRERMEEEPFLTRWNVFLSNTEKVLLTEPHNARETGKAGNARTYLAHAGKSSFAYVITKEKKYADRAIAEAMAMVEGVIPTSEGTLGWYNPNSRDWNKGADLNTAEICYALAMVYDWCYDAMSPQERKKIKNAIMDKGIRHYLVSIEGERPDFWVGNPVSNWAGVLHGGVGLAALALYNESDTARKVTDYARESIPGFLDHVFLEDGGGHEGVMYARYGELFGLYFMMASQRLFGMDIDFLEELNRRMAGYWDIYMQAPDSRYANFNNMGENTFEGLWGKDHRHMGGPNSDICALMETLAPGGDPLLLWGADNGAPRYYWDGASPWSFLWRKASAGAVSPQSKPGLQDAVLFRGAGHAILQSDHLWLAFNGGWTSDRSHNNRDLGSFILVADKERMVHDPGYGDSEARHHSTITFNDEDQVKAGTGKYLEFGSGKAFHYLANDLTEAYDAKHLDQFIRHLLFVRDGYLVVMDEVKVKDGGQLKWWLQTRHRAEVVDGHTLIHGEQHCMHLIDAGDQMETRIIGWEEKNGSMNAVQKTPVFSKQEYLIISVLYPVLLDEKRAAPVPAASFDKGVLSLTRPGGEKDVIRFGHQGNRWVLEGFNEESGWDIQDGSKRTLVPFRETGKYGIEIHELPSWFLPITD